MKEELEKLREHCFLEVSCYGALSDPPGTDGVIITKNKKIYYYHNYESRFFVSKNSLSSGYPLKEETYLKLVQYIEKNILNKDFEPRIICDAIFTIRGNYQGTPFYLENYIDMYDDLMKIIKK